MTSPSRKKHPTTRPNSTENSVEHLVPTLCVGTHYPAALRPLPICNLQSVLVIAAALTFALATTARAEVTKLQWGSQRTAAKKQDNKQTALRFVKPGITSNASATKPATAPIKLVVYDEPSAPRLTSGRETEPGTRSVVVSRGDDSSDGFRSAQLPGSNPSASRSALSPPTAFKARRCGASPISR